MFGKKVDKQSKMDDREDYFLYCLLAVDIDGTLLDSQGRLSPQNKAAVAKALSAGAMVVPATGRAYRAMEWVCKELKLGTTPVIVSGGAKVVEYPSGNIVYEKLMRPEDVRDILDFTFEQQVYAQVYDRQDVFLYQEEREEADFYATRLRYQGRKADLKHGVFCETPKVLLTVAEDKVQDTYRVARTHFGERFRIVQSGPRFLEFFPPDVDKGQALAWLGASVGRPADSMIAMGDTGIDIAMIKYAGLGIAVANATPETKAAADIVTVSCDENAVAQVIDEYMITG